MNTFNSKTFVKTFDVARRHTSSRGITAALGGLIGFIVFCMIFDLRTVNPFSTAWIFNIGGDLAQHYIGWSYYRDSVWHFPNIGHIDNLAYPFGISLVYMDAIPLLAIFFKVFSGIIPDNFQYFGLFTLLSFVLQGIIATLIILRFTSRRSLALLGAVFFVLSPILISRAFAHTALTAHWLILLSILFLIIFQQEKITLKRQVTSWAILLCVAVLIHPYFVPIVGAVFMLSAIQQHVTFVQSATRLVIPPVCMLVIFWLIGGLSSGMKSLGGSGLGLYSYNLLSPIAPLGFSSLISSTQKNIHWEGLAYLGLGVILLIPVAWLMWIHTKRHSSKLDIYKNIFRAPEPKTLLSTMLIAALIVGALSPLVYLGDSLLINIPIPSIIERLWGSFRATGRLFWPIYYLIVTGLYIYLIRRSREWTLGVTLILILPFALLQAIDVIGSSAVEAKKEKVSQSLKSRSYSKLNGTFIDSYCQKDKVMIVDNSLKSGVKIFHDLSSYIATCEPALTSGYFARFPERSILSLANKERNKLINGSAVLSKSTLYVTQSEEFTKEIDQAKYKSLRHGDYWIIESKTEL